MNTKAMINKGKIRHSATLSVSQPPKFSRTKPVRLRINIATNSGILDKLKSQEKERGIPRRYLLATAIVKANAEILDNCFGGLGSEEFLGLFPYLLKPEIKYDSEMEVISDRTTIAVAKIFAVASNQTFSDYVNNSLWKALQNFSLARLRHFQRQRYG